MPTFRRGAEAVKEAINNQGSGRSDFKPFAPEIRWRESGEEKYVLILTSPSEKIVTAPLHEFIPVGKGERNDGSTYIKYESFISRKYFGEADHLEDKFEALARTKTLGVAVELEPQMEEVRGRLRPKGFSVKTESFNTRENGMKEAPIIGILNQAPGNFWGWLIAYDETRAPVPETPLSATRRGDGKDTEYDFVPFEGTDIDLSPLFENIENVSYLSGVDLPGGDDLDAAIAIGEELLEKRVNELADEDRYNELVLPIKDYKPKFPRTPREQGKKGAKAVDPEVVSPDRRAAFAALRAEVEGS